MTHIGSGTTTGGRSARERWKRLLKRYWFAHAVAIVVCVVCLVPAILPVVPPYSLRFQAFESQRGGIGPEKLFELRLESYNAKLKDLNANMQFQGVFIVVSIMLLIRQSRSMNLSVFGTDVPLNWLHFLIPLVMMSLWMQFGFLLDDVIKNRLIGWYLLNASGDLPGTKLMSARPLFNDGGFIDGWFIHFTDGQYSINSSPTTGTRLYFGIVYGFFFGWAHACVLSVIQAGNHRFLQNSRIKRLSLVLPWIALGLIIASHFYFAYGGQNPNWLQFCVAFFMVLLTYGLVWLARHADEPGGEKRTIFPGEINPSGGLTREQTGEE